jgi:hypothetical protein
MFSRIPYTGNYPIANHFTCAVKHRHETKADILIRALIGVDTYQLSVGFVAFLFPDV